MRDLTLFAWELAITARALNGTDPDADVCWLLGRLAMNAPHTAVHLRRVMRALDPDVAATVRRLAATPPVTPVVTKLDAPPRVAATSDMLTPRQAADLTGVGEAAVRAALRRGTLHGRRDPGGRWHVRREDLTAWRQRHGETGTDTRSDDR
jgi:excisionase family DNA binding protein